MAGDPRSSLLQRVLRWAAWVLLHLLARAEVQGLEHVPPTGSLIVASNHLHALDLPIAYAVIPRRQAVFAADKWQKTVGGWIMRLFADTIFVARGEADRQAMNKAMAVLRAGGALGVAPEGTRSRSGGLLPGKPGIIYLASRTGSPILPMVIWGQERAMSAWARLRRPEIHIHIGEPMCLPPGAEQARSAQLAEYTDQLMLVLARMLPAQYRGVYADRVTDAPPD